MHTYLLHQLLVHSAQTYPGREAVVFRNQSITYADLDTKSSRLAVNLSKLGVKPGDRVGIVLNKSIESIISIFGILKAGAAYVPVDPMLPMARVRHLIDHCGIKCAITSLKNLPKVAPSTEYPTSIQTVVLTEGDLDPSVVRSPYIEAVPWDDAMSESSAEFIPLHISDGNIAYILHTSGSTGLPKGVAISHLNALTFVNMAAAFFGINHRDRFAGFAPLHFDLSVFDIFVAVKKGASIVLTPEYLTAFPLKLAEYIDEKKVSVWNSASSALCMLVDRGRLDRFRLESLRLVHFSGDIMPVKYLRILTHAMKNAAFYNIYGQTEANSSMCYRIKEIPDDAAWKIPIGKPFPNFEVFALDEHGQRVTRPGERGELYVKSSTVAMGYWNDEGKTEEKFVRDPLCPQVAQKVYRTGDLVELDHNADYVFAGRMDHMVKSRGYRIELSEIELVLTGHPSVRQAVAVALPDELVGHKIFAFVTPYDGADLSKPDLVNYCDRIMPTYMIPETFFLCDDLPRSSTGKVNRKALESDAAQRLRM